MSGVRTSILPHRVTTGHAKRDGATCLFPGGVADIAGAGAGPPAKSADSAAGFTVSGR